MKEDKLSTQSMDFAVSIIELVKFLKEKRESIISNQIGRSGTSIGANIREAHYAHGNFFYKYVTDCSRTDAELRKALRCDGVLAEELVAFSLESHSERIDGLAVGVRPCTRLVVDLLDNS